MPTASPKCPACDKAMELGYLARPWVSRPLQPYVWVAGRPETPAILGTGANRKKPRAVTSWRCKDCGRLESYAN